MTARGSALWVGSVVLMVACSAAAVMPAAADAWSECQNKSAPDIASCSAVIASGEANPDRLGTAYLYRGFGYYMKGQRDQALADFNETIRLDAKAAPAAYSNRGAILMEQGKDDLALADFDEAIRREPRDSMTFSNRGGVYGKQRGGYEKAIADLNEAIRLDGKNVRAYANRGWVQSRAGKYGEAILDLNRAIQLNPGFAMAYNNRGYTFNRMGRATVRPRTSARRSGSTRRIFSPTPTAVTSISTRAIRPPRFRISPRRSR
jgi:tetratricopeptide (TPR) repeat protein